MSLLRPWRLAFLDLVHRPGRSAAALVGVVFAIVLLYMQSGFYLACRDSATRIHDLLDFDAAITSARYAFVLKADSLPRDRLESARAVPGVASVSPVRVGPGQWRSPDTGRSYDLVLLGVEPADRPFAVEELDEMLPRLHRAETVLFDEAAHPILGRNPVGTVSEFAGRRLRVVGTFRWGAGFVANGLAVTAGTTFDRVFPRRPSDAVQLGLVRLASFGDGEFGDGEFGDGDFGDGAAADARVEQVVERLRARLPADVRVWTRAEIEARDRRFFLAERPIGLMFTSGVFLAAVVGAVILFQLLASEVAARRAEFATLKALGSSNAEVYAVVVAQGCLYTLAAFLPATLAAAVLFEITRRLARLPMDLDPLLVLAVLAASLATCLAGALAAARKVRRADPAELF